MFKKTFLSLLTACSLIIGFAPQTFAEGCYICTSGSSDQCKDYCRYSGSDNFESRKKCESAGCKIGGNASCPTSENYVICEPGGKSESSSHPKNKK